MKIVIVKSPKLFGGLLRRLFGIKKESYIEYLVCIGSAAAICRGSCHVPQKYRFAFVGKCCIIGDGSAPGTGRLTAADSHGAMGEKVGFSTRWVAVLAAGSVCRTAGL